MNELGFNQTELAARCAMTGQDQFPDGQRANITRERIAKILMHCKANPGKSAARVISSQELRVLAEVLKVSIEWLAGRDLVLWDPLAEPHRASHILHIMNEHEDKATEVLIWAEYLISPLETPEFMHKHHEALFSDVDILGGQEERRKVVQIYDSIGNAQRKRLLDSKRKRRKLIQFIFSSDIKRIALGTEEYAGIHKGLRKACLENLANLISDSSDGIELVIISAKEAQQAKAAFRDYDSIAVFDEGFVLWRYRSGRIAWSEYPMHARRYRSVLKGLQMGSGGSGSDTLRAVRRLVGSIH
ncbi:MAG: hypothetical protein AABO41_26540 [Acidobacteriota bacterium]